MGEQNIRFRLNTAEVSLSRINAEDTLLDYLRLSRGLTGTKEGCAEGDCGACTVLVGRLTPNGLQYETVNACIRLLGSLNACHVVTVEALMDGGTLHPVQQAMVAHHGSQCGFCTPGIVMSLYALWMQSPSPTITEAETALQGNLCRCTGYAPIIRAAMNIAGEPAADKLLTERTAVEQHLSSLQPGGRIEINDQIIIPCDVADLAEALTQHPDATLVAGATDVGLWVTKDKRRIAPAIFISHLDALHEITYGQDGLILGAAVSYSDAAGPIIQHFPHRAELWSRIGGEQVRNMGTVGGNIANGSPIGDTPPALIALSAEITLSSATGTRCLPLAEYFIKYGEQDRGAGEFVHSIRIPYTQPDTHHAVYKISKRRDEDITAICAAFAFDLADGQVRAATIAFGGMAGTPKRARHAEAALCGRPWHEGSVVAAQQALIQDFSPLSDWRASADYRMKVAQNLIYRFYLETVTGAPHALNRDNVIGGQR